MPNKYKDGAKTYRRSYFPEYKKRNPKEYGTPGVYVWVAPDGKADYVGRGSLARAKSHKYRYTNPRHDNAWWTPNHILLYMTCENEWQAMEYEGKWGQYYQPRHNRDGYRYQDMPKISVVRLNGY